MKEVRTEDGFQRWLSGAKKGDKVMYYEGNLMFDRQALLLSPGKEAPDRVKAANAAWQAYRREMVALVQHRRDSGDYEYIAQRS